MRVLRILTTFGLLSAMAWPATAQTTYTCFGLEATILGTPEDDELWGTNGIDVMAAFGGNDLVVGDRRRDFMCGGAGNDFMSGGGSGDSLDGSTGADYLTASEGNDTLIGGDGDDYFQTYSGDDRAYGGPGNDVFDILDANSNDHTHDVIHGGPGNDKVYSQGDGGGSDDLYGDDGDDRLDSTAGTLGSEAGGPDLVDGGEGYDKCFVDAVDEVLNCEDVRVVIK